MVSVYTGEEEEIRYRLCEDGDRRFLVPEGRQKTQPGQVTTLIPPEEDIHQVSNVGEGKAISIHVYGADIGKLGSSINRTFDDLPILPFPEAPGVSTGVDRACQGLLRETSPNVTESPSWGR